MTTLKKLSVITICILLLSILLPNIGLLYSKSGLGWQFPYWLNFSFVINDFSYYLFWASVVLSIVLVIVIFTLILSPKNKLDLPLSNSKGTLSLEKSAIEGLVRSVLTESAYMKDSKVMTTLSKQKCHIMVEGKLLPTRDILETSRLLQRQIEEELNAFLGLHHGVHLHVRIHNLHQASLSPKNHARVK